MKTINQNLLLRQALEIAQNVNTLLDRAFTAHVAYVASNQQRG